jgi:hypothetical protein
MMSEPGHVLIAVPPQPRPVRPESGPASVLRRPRDPAGRTGLSAAVLQQLTAPGLELQ